MFSITSLDATNDVGQFSSVTIGRDGLGLISYHDVTGGALKVAHCSDVRCTTATISIVDSGGVGQYSSITIGQDGLGAISYHDETNGKLKVAHCSDLECSAATTVTVDTNTSVGQYSAITIGRDGFPLISYYDAIAEGLKVAHCGSIDCSSGNTLTLVDDQTSPVGKHTSITIGADGFGLVSYYNEVTVPPNLKIAHCTNVDCSASSLFNIGSSSNTGQFSSITIGGDGFGMASYFNSGGGELRLVDCGNAGCSAGNTISVIDNGGSDDVGQGTSITIGVDGGAVISYLDITTSTLRVAHCTSTSGSCSSSTFVTADDAGTIGGTTAITIGADGMPLITYYDATNGDLKVLHASNVFAVPYHRRR